MSGMALAEEGERRAATLARSVAAVLGTGDVELARRLASSWPTSWGKCSSLARERSRYSGRGSSGSLHFQRSGRSQTVRKSSAKSAWVESRKFVPTKF
jgi:hypothetical protein